MPDHIQTLRERAAYLRERVAAKQRVGWDSAYDERERVALEWVIARVTEQQECTQPSGLVPLL